MEIEVSDDSFNETSSLSAVDDDGDSCSDDDDQQNKVPDSSDGAQNQQPDFFEETKTAKNIQLQQMSTKEINQETIKILNNNGPEEEEQNYNNVEGYDEGNEDEIEPSIKLKDD